MTLAINDRRKQLYETSQQIFSSVEPLQPLDVNMPKSEEELFHAREACLEDASKHFRKISHVKERFDTWKRSYPKEYEQAYGAMSLAGLFDLYVRHELLIWKPFVVNLYSDRF